LAAALAMSTACGTEQSAEAKNAPAKQRRADRQRVTKHAAPAKRVAAKRAPAYDLTKDLELRKKEASRLLGKRTRFHVVQKVFLVAGAPSMGRRFFGRSVSLTKRATHAYFNKRFAKRPAKAVSVYLFGNKRAYNKFCRKHHGGCGTPYGVYYHSPRRIVMNASPGLGTLTHELVHPIVETDFPNAPSWLNEGIASLFEYPYIPRKGEIHGKTNWRLPQLRRAHRTKAGRTRASLGRLFSMSDRDFRGRYEGLYYSMSRYLAQWLDSKKMLWKFYQRWRDNYATDKSGAKAFKAVVGKTPAKANREWARWVKRL